MDAAQFAQFMAALQRNRPSSKKLDTFSSGDGVEWMTWRSNFEITARINEWTHRRQRREIAAAMVGAAKQFVADIPIGDADPVENSALLLDQYQLRFLPAAATDAARIAVREARQTEDETILAWHARLRSLFQRAHPALDAAGLEVNVDLRDQFVLGMLDQDVVSKVWHQRPGSYGEALTMANNVSAGNAIIQSRATERPAPAIKREPNVNALGDTDGGSAINKTGPPGGCWDCGGNHYARDCPKGGRAAGRGRGRSMKAGPPRRGRVSKTRGRGGRTRGSGRFTGRRRIQGLQEEAEPASIGSIGDIFEDDEMSEDAEMEGQGNF